MKKIRIGCGAGYGGDRIEPAVELAQKGDIGYLVFECLAERTIAIGQRQKKHNPKAGYNELLADRMKAVLPICLTKGIKIVTNMGSANPREAAKVTAEIAQSLGAKNLKIAIIEGDNVYDIALKEDLILDELKLPLSQCGKKIISANAYIGAQPIADALNQGADIVIAGRVSDPSLFLSIMMHEFNWQDTDWPLLGKGTIIGHLLECAGQITGGYFADPGFKDVPNLANLGFPIAEVSQDGHAIITKVEGSGGVVNLDTCKAQMLYEIHRPDEYKTPDVIADFTHVTFTQLGKDRIAVDGGTGRARPETLKVSVGYEEGFIGEGEMSYAGPGAVERGKLALDIVRQRFEIRHIHPIEVRYDLIGINSLHGQTLSQHSQPYEVRARVAARFDNKADALAVGNEVEALYTNGPAGGGGAMKSVKEVVAMDSTYIPRHLVTTTIDYLEVQ